MGAVGDSDAVLWRSWRAKRDAGAFERLVRPHLAFASAFARRVGFRGQDADEVVQRSLVALAAEARETPIAVGVRAWIGRSVLSEARMLSRSDRRRAAREEVVAREREVRATPSQAIETRDQVGAALALLDPDDRWLVELRFLHDLEYREVAFVTGRSALACRLRVHRALARLRRTIGPSAPLLVAAIPLPRPSASADLAVNRAVETATVEGVGAAAALAGGLVVGTSSKVAIAAGVLLLVGGGWFVATRESDEATSRGGVDLETDRRAAEAPRLLAAARSAGVADARDTGVPSPGSNASGPPVPGRPSAKGHGSVEGTIRFDDGTPMANVRVALTIGPREDGRDTTLTDAHGRFRLDDEWVGPRSLTLVQVDGGVVVLREITLEPDRVVSVDAIVARGVTVSGTVVDARDREPVPGAWVTLRRPSQARAQAVYGGAKTDANGRFRFEHVPPAHVTVEFVRPGREPRLEVLDVGTRDVVLDVALAKSRPLFVRYEPVPKEAVGERVAWMLEGPIGPPERFLHGSRGEEASVTLSAAGELRLDAPPPGRYHLAFFATKTLPAFETDFEVTESEAPVIRVPLAPASRVTGTVLDATGTPLSGVRVGLAGLVSDPTDDAGRFSFARVATGIQEATVLVSGIRVRVPPVVVSAVGETNLELRMPGTSGLGVTLTTPAPYGGWLDVRVESGESVASGNVWTGKPVSLLGLPSGSHVVSLWLDDHVSLQRTVTLEPGETLALGEVALAAMPVVPVRVTLPAGAPRPQSVRVHVRERMPPGESGYTTPGRIEWDADGRAWLKGLPAARYRVAMQWTPSANAADLPEFEIDVRDGIEVPIDLALR
jgi:RNA polymerase sigma-70 factor (ECF subfamily)